MGKVLFFSGAGLSADSGLGTFRGHNGLWEKYDVDVVCNIHSWRDNYTRVHEFYNKRRIEYAKAQPNAMHKTIADLQAKYGSDKVIVITQNIDDLLERAGCVEVIHVHGEINYIYCINCGDKYKVDGAFEGRKCKKCGKSIFKPFVVFFAEQAPLYKDLYEMIDSLTSEDLICVIGTEGSVVQIGAIIGSKSSGLPAKRLLCNLEKSPYIKDKEFDIVYYESAANAAPKIYAEADKILSSDK